MSKFYVVEYRVKIKAEDDDEAELLSIDLEGDIRHLHKNILWVNCDPFMEEVEE